MSYGSLDHLRVVWKKSRYELKRWETYKPWALCETDGYTLWLRELMYAIKGDLLGFIGPKRRSPGKKVVWKKSRSKDKKILSPFWNGQKDIVAYRGNVYNQKGSPRVHCIIGRLDAKNPEPKSRDKKDICL